MEIKLLAFCVSLKMLFFRFSSLKNLQGSFFSSFLFEKRSQRNEKPKKFLGITI